MKRISRTGMLLAALTLGITAGYSAAAAARESSTPKNWTYEIKNGKRVPKPTSRVTNADGSWREEVRQGNCVTVKERSASGELKVTRRCD